MIWNRENNNGHGKDVRSVIERVAPEATIYSASISSSTSGDKLNRLVTIYEGVEYQVEDFIKKYNIKIISSSILGNTNSKELIDKWGYLKEKI